MQITYCMLYLCYADKHGLCAEQENLWTPRPTVMYLMFMQVNLNLTYKNQDQFHQEI